MIKAHPTNPAAVWAPRADGKGFHWTVNPAAVVAPADEPKQQGEAKPARKGKAKA